MKITVITLTHNEEDLLPFFCRHYWQFVDRIIVYDNASTDATRLLVSRYGCELKLYDTGGVLRDDLNVDIKNTAWKSMQSDWFIVVDIDEFLYHENMRQLLQGYMNKGINFPEVIGYGMIGYYKPESGLLTDHFKEGIPDPNYNKRVVFRPEAQPVYEPGAHCFSVGNNVVGCASEIKLLHYKYAFGREWLKNRIPGRLNLSQENIAHGWGTGNSVESFLAAFDYVMEHKQQVI